MPILSSLGGMSNKGFVGTGEILPSTLFTWENNADFILTKNNRIATRDLSGWRSVRSNQTYASSFRFTIRLANSPIAIGFGTSTTPLNTFVGDGSTSIGWRLDTDQLYVNGSFVAGGAGGNTAAYFVCQFSSIDATFSQVTFFSGNSSLSQTQRYTRQVAIASNVRAMASAQDGGSLVLYSSEFGG